VSKQPTIPLEKHLRIVRECDRRFAEERDRRYAEVASARAEALRIKQDADTVALDLARQIQTYKDEQANELRSQIESERGGYVTKDQLAAANERKQLSSTTWQIALVGFVITVVLAVVVLIANGQI
jgi:vacuolar-type H+-ATPase subunit H